MGVRPFHHQIQFVLVEVEHCQYTRVVQPGGDASLSGESSTSFLVVGECTADLFDRDLSAQSNVSAAEHLTRTTRQMGEVISEHLPRMSISRPVRARDLFDVTGTEQASEGGQLLGQTVRQQGGVAYSVRMGDSRSVPTQPIGPGRCRSWACPDVTAGP
nr:hypothetical protein [Nocardia sp. BMG111209]